MSYDEKFKSMQRRVAMLYRNAATRPHQHELLPEAFEELQNALEELQAMHDDMRLQHDNLLNSREQIESERQSYQDLFIHAPVAYLITSLDGAIHRANQTAAILLHTNEKSLIGRSLALFIPDGERRIFREQLHQLRQADHIVTWEARIQPWHGTPISAVLTAAVARGSLGHPIAIRWIVQDITARQQVESQLRARISELEQQVHKLTEQLDARA
jgi:PAS domain S-box-containing protein